jgi:hypothetical protein
MYAKMRRYARYSMRQRLPPAPVVLHCTSNFNLKTITDRIPEATINSRITNALKLDEK